MSERGWTLIREFILEKPVTKVVLQKQWERVCTKSKACCFQGLKLIKCGVYIHSKHGNKRADMAEINTYQFRKNVKYHAKGFLFCLECYEDSSKEFKQGNDAMKIEL